MLTGRALLSHQMHRVRDNMGLHGCGEAVCMLVQLLSRPAARAIRARSV